MKFSWRKTGGGGEKKNIGLGNQSSGGEIMCPEKAAINRGGNEICEKRRRMKAQREMK